MIIKDYVIQNDFTIDEVFGDDQKDLKDTIGDIRIDDNGDRILIVNTNGTHLRTYSMRDVR